MTGQIKERLFGVFRNNNNNFVIKLIEMDNNNGKKLEGPKLWLFLWCVFHGFALLMSTAKVRFFYTTTDNYYYKNYNSDELPTPEQNFWPFVDFNAATFYPEDYPEGTTAYDAVFNGIFAYYDVTEFAFYVGIGVVIYFLRNNIKNLFS